MASLEAVDYDPFAQAPAASGAALEPVAHDPFANPATAYKDPSKPWYSRLGLLADDVARTAADGATAGFLDKGLGGDERAKTEAAKERLGLPASIVAEGAGAFGPMGIASKIARSGAALIPKIGAWTQAPGAAGFAARTGAMAAEGSGYGAASAAGHDQDIAKGAAIGAGAGAVGNVAGEAIGKSVGAIAGAFNKKPPHVKESGEFFDKGTGAYQARDAAGVIVRPEGVQKLATDVKSDLADMGYDPALAPQMRVVVDRLDELSKGNITTQGIDTLRRVAGARIDPGNRYQTQLSTEVTKRIDDWFENKLKPEDILTGDKTEAVRAWQDAKRNWATARKSEMVENAIEAAKDKTGSAHSGGNYENHLRQEFKSILRNPKKLRGFTEDERTAMQEVVRGGFSSALRSLGKLSPEGSGMMLILQTLGAVQTGGMSIPLAAVGAGAKRASEHVTSKNVEGLARIIQNQGLAQPAVKNAVQRLSEAERESLSRLLTGAGVVGAGEVVPLGTP
jgi:hypothetical protein